MMRTKYRPANIDSDSSDDPVKKHTWKSCCFVIDARFTLFTAQLLITLPALAFCMVELYRSNGKCEAVAFYGNFLSTLVGLWMPSPILGPQK